MGSDASLFVSGQTFINQFLLDIIENDGSAAVCHSGGDSKTDAVRSAGDQGNLAGQIKRFRGADRHISYLLKVMLCNSKPRIERQGNGIRNEERINNKE